MGSISLGSLVGAMIFLPKGCSVPFTVTIEIDELTEEMIEWFVMIGGTTFEKEWFDFIGKRRTQPYVQYGEAKPCHYHQNGLGGVRLQFHGNDASTASVFVMKFFEHVQSTNLKEQMERAAEGFTTY